MRCSPSQSWSRPSSKRPSRSRAPPILTEGNTSDMVGMPCSIPSLCASCAQVICVAASPRNPRVCAPSVSASPRSKGGRVARHAGDFGYTPPAPGRDIRGSRGIERRNSRTPPVDHSSCFYKYGRVFRSRRHCEPARHEPVLLTYLPARRWYSSWSDSRKY